MIDLTDLLARAEQWLSDPVQDAETLFPIVRDLVAAVRALQSERDDRLREVEHWVTRYNELERWRIATRQRAEAAEQERDHERHEKETVADAMKAYQRWAEARLTALRGLVEEMRKKTVAYPESPEEARYYDGFDAGRESCADQLSARLPEQEESK